MIKQTLPVMIVLYACSSVCALTKHNVFIACSFFDIFFYLLANKTLHYKQRGINSSFWSFIYWMSNVNQILKLSTQMELFLLKNVSCQTQIFWIEMCLFSDFQVIVPWWKYGSCHFWFYSNKAIVLFIGWIIFWFTDQDIIWLATQVIL